MPLKTCNWNCIYCQLGRTRPLTNLRREYFPKRLILDDVRRELEAHPAGEIDWVTIVGSGEPTLYSELGWLIRQVKGLTHLPVAVITNGSLLFMPQVRADLAAADAVLPTLDAGEPGLYRRIHRPHPGYSFTRVVDGMIAFRQEFAGKFWVEVMLMRGVNDGEAALREIAAVLERIQPEKIHIVWPTRPPAETWVQPPDEAGLMRALAILGESAQVVDVLESTFDLSRCEPLEDAILSIISRHPMRKDELVSALDRWSPGKVEQRLADLESDGRIQIVERFGIRFYGSRAAFFPNKDVSLRSMPKTVSAWEEQPG